MFCNDNNHKKQGGSLLGFPHSCPPEKSVLCAVGNGSVRNFGVTGWGILGRNCILLCLRSGGMCPFLGGSSGINCWVSLNFPLKPWSVSGGGSDLLDLLVVKFFEISFFPSGSVKSCPVCVCIFLTEWFYVLCVCPYRCVCYTGFELNYWGLES